MKKFKKYRASIPNLAIIAGVDIVCICLYAIILNYLQDPDADMYVLMNLASNVLLVAISILSTVLFTTPLVDVTAKNALYNKILLEDVLSDPRFYNALPKDEREKMLRGLEANLHFRGSPTKENMFHSIRKKLNTYYDREEAEADQCYLESCSYNIKCEIRDGYFYKTISKTIDIRAYEPIIRKDFLLCSTEAPLLEGHDSVSKIEALSINGQLKVVTDCVETRSSDIRNDAFNKKRGYTCRSAHFYKGDLHLTPDRPMKIQIDYKTYVPIYDTFYSCRTPYPCHKFKFTYMLSGECADKYSLSVCAFGFADDGKETPNRADENPDIEVNFDSWIFPLDGVAVSMLKKDQNP